MSSLEMSIAWRYLRSRRGSKLLSFISVIAIVGVVVGVAGALALTRTMKSLLFEVSATDPTVFTAIPVLLVLVSLFACYTPARRATRVDPLEALRDE